MDYKKTKPKFNNGDFIRSKDGKIETEVLEIDGGTRFILFALLCLFGPTSGMVFGGIICSKIGGYVKRKSMTFVIISMSIATAISMTIACHKISAIFIIAGWT